MLHRLFDLLERGVVKGAGALQKCFNTSEGYALVFGTSAPSGAGYAPGCVFVNTSTGVVYRNSGTAVTASWTNIGTGSTGVIANNCTLDDGGAVDATLALTTQTGSKPTLTIPDFAGVNDTFVFATKAATLAGKTLTAPVINGGTLNVASTGAKFMKVACGTALGTADRTLTITIPDAACALTLTADLIRVGAHSLTLTTSNTTDVMLPTTGTLATLAGIESLSNKTLADNTCTFADSADPAKKLAFECSGITTANTRTLTVLDYSGTIPAYAGAAAQGEILYCSAAGVWSRLGVGTAGNALITAGAASNPYWGPVSTSAIANNTLLDDAGAVNALLALTTQTVGQPTLTIPDFANVSDTFAFCTLAQTFTNKTLTAPAITGGTAIELTGLSIRSTGGNDLIFASSAAYSADRTLTVNIPTGANAALTLTGDLIRVGAHSLTLTTGAVTDVTLPASGTLAIVDGALGNCTVTTVNKLTLTQPANGSTLTIADAKVLTASNTITLAAAADGQTYTFPAGGAAVCTIDASQTLTNKTYDADGTGNALSNVNGDNMKAVTWPAANGTFPFTVPFILITKVSNKNGWTDSAVTPCKCRLVRAWSINCSADGGQWKLGTAGGVADLTQLQTVAASDNDLDYLTDLDNAQYSFASGVAVGIWSDAALDAEIFCEFVPEA